MSRDRDIIEEKDKVLSFTLFRVEKGREKICKCKAPHYVIDTVNRIVICEDCGATLDAFDALERLVDHVKRYEEFQKEAIRKTNAYREEANKELRRRFRNRAFKEMDQHYKSGMYPICPECGNIFDPSEIKRWTRKKYKQEDEQCQQYVMQLHVTTTTVLGHVNW